MDPEDAKEDDLKLIREVHEETSRIYTVEAKRMLDEIEVEMDD